VTAPEEPPKLDVVKHGAYVHLSPELLADANGSGIAEAVLRALTAPRPTPQQAAERREREARERAEERERAARVPLTIDALIEAMGWSRAYAEHLVQPYCDCYPGEDGWVDCEHARDLRLTP
jgi:hypothetical protein